MKTVATRYNGLIMLVTLAILVLFTATQAMAQMGGGPGQGRRSMNRPMYDVSTETTVKGTVEEVQQLTAQSDASSSGARWGNCPRGWAGTHLSVKTDQGTLIVHVGPSAYLTEKNFTIAKGDELSITGSKVQYQGSNFLIAKEITEGDQVLTLRDARGFPLWAGWRRGSTMPATPPAN